MTQKWTGLTAVIITFAAAISSAGFAGCVADSANPLPLLYGSKPMPLVGAQPFAASTAPIDLAAPKVERAEESTPPSQLPEVDAFPSALQPEQPLRGWTHIVFHHTATGGGDVEAIDSVHRERTDEAGNPWLGIGYHFVIGNGNGMPDGLVEPTFRWKEQLHGAHAGDRAHNETSIGICLVGDFEQGPPTERQLASLEQLVSMLRDQLDIPSERLLGHGELKATACPGRFFPLEEVIALSDKKHSPEGNAVPVATVGTLHR